MEIFNKVLKNEIPENTVLSHDLLEGNYLRCGLTTDILILDDYPERYSTYILRQARWIRGDFQIYPWLKNRIVTKNKSIKKNPFGVLDKFKIFDNLRRSLIPIFSLLALILFADYRIKILSIIGYTISTILDILNFVIFKKGKDSRYIYAHKSFIPNINPLKASIIRGILELSSLPHRAYISFISITKTLYRMNVSKMHLLEWLTAEEAEKQTELNLLSYYKFMWVNILSSMVYLFFAIITKELFYIFFFVLWTVSPYVLWKISKQTNQKISKKETISFSDKKYLLDVGKKTWQFFKDNLNEENNFLPPDNYQEDRLKLIARKNINNKYWFRIAFYYICL